MVGFAEDDVVLEATHGMAMVILRHICRLLLWLQAVMLLSLVALDAPALLPSSKAMCRAHITEITDITVPTVVPTVVPTGDWFNSGPPGCKVWG